jgi:dephospho-CoA kinase
MLSILLFIYSTIMFIILTLLTMVVQRLYKTNKNRPFHIYVGLYVVNTLVLNYIFGIAPYKSVLVNLFSFLLSQYAGVRMRVMGLTGQISSGKSTVGKYLESKYNAKIIDIDKLNKEVLEDEEVKKQIRFKFGDDVFNNGVLDKLKMREIIFSDEKKKKALEAITHPKVFKKLIISILKEKLLYSRKFLIIENAILLRFSFFVYLCFPIISVCSSNSADIVARIMKRDNCSKDVAMNILNSQMTLQEFIDKSDVVLINNEGFDELYKQVDEFVSKIL